MNHSDLLKLQYVAAYGRKDQSFELPFFRGVAGIPDVVGLISFWFSNFRAQYCYISYKSGDSMMSSAVMLTNLHSNHGMRKHSRWMYLGLYFHLVSIDLVIRAQKYSSLASDIDDNRWIFVALLVTTPILLNHW